MPYEVPSGARLLITFEGIHMGQQVMTTTCWRVTSFGPVPDGSAMLEAVYTAITAAGKLYPTWRDCLSEEVTGIKMKLQWVQPVRYAHRQFDVTPNTGDVVGVSMPSNVAAVITRRTDGVGPGQFGNLHMPGVPRTFISDGYLTTDATLVYAAFAVEAITGFSATAGADTADFKPEPYSQTAPLVENPYTTYAIQDTSRVERRRSIRLGS